MLLENFKTAMKILIRATKTHDIGADDLKAYYEIMKDDFTDDEFKEICLKLTKTATFFPVVAKFYELKKRPDIPEMGDLLYLYGCLREGRQFGEDSRKKIPWLQQVMKYFSGRSCSNWREMTEQEYDWFCRDFSKAYDAFLSDYQKGVAVRIDYSAIPEINAPRSGPSKLGDVLKSQIPEQKKLGGGVIDV